MSDSSPDLLRMVMARLQEGVLIFGADGAIRDANPAAAAILGVPAEALVGLSVADVEADVREADGVSLSWEQRPIHRALSGEQVSGLVLSFVRGDGKTVWIELEAGPIEGADGEPAGVVSTFTDVTNRIERERRFRHEAYHDHLTGLANRRLLERTLDATVARAEQNGRGVAVLLIDLDGFKEINDQHGHSAGDDVLRELATRLRRNLRERDLVARYGGDEFVLVLADLRHPEEVAESFAERVHDALVEPVSLGGRLVQVRGSIGKACSPHDGDAAAALLAAADRAMYSAKPAGR